MESLARSRAAGAPVQPGEILLRIEPTDAAFLRRLAKVIRRVVGRGRTYQDSTWKWIAPRTADALDRLSDCLAALG